MGEIEIFLKKSYWLSVYYITKERLIMQFGRSRTGILLPMFRPMLYGLLYAYAVGRVARFHMENYIVFVLTGVMIWNFISVCIISSHMAFGTNVYIIRTKPISKTIFAFSFILEKMIIDGASIVIIFIYMLAFCNLHITPILPIVIVYLGAILLFCVLVTVGLAYISLYSQDLTTIISGITPLFLWVTPIIYPIETLDGLMGWVSQFNPFYILINPIVQILYYQRLPSVESNLYLACLLMITGGISYFIYKKLSRNAVYYLS